MKNPTFELAQEAIDMLFPLHVSIASDGTIKSVGATLGRILGDNAVAGANFFDAFSVDKPRSIADFATLLDKVGSKLHISTVLDDGDPITFRGVATPLGEERHLLLIDLSFGSALSAAVKRFGLSSTDFRTNDPSIDLLYTFETQHALLEDSRKLAQALGRAKDEAERKAYQDPLTGIANCRALHDRLNWALSKDDKRQQFAVLLIDLDHFKAINDTFGHAAGDCVLMSTAECLRMFSREDDLAVRIGGDEFALVLGNMPDDIGLMAIADRLQRKLCEPILFEGITLKVRASVGAARIPPDPDATSDTLLRHADIALYAAKEERNAIKLLTPDMISRHRETTALLMEIERAIDRGEFTPYFQPQIDDRTNRVTGLEVLARWNHPEDGIRPPAYFLEAAIQANLIRKIDEAVRRKAMQHFLDWKAYTADVKLSFNLTAQNLHAPEFIEQLQDELLLAGLSPERIQLELLESILFDASDTSLYARAHTLLDAGFSLALDDFGTGHASIATLIDIPISMLKIDRSFVTGLDRNPKLKRITNSILAMANGIGLDVLAEGVETNGELNLLRQAGCRFFQGYLYSMPLDAASMQEWLTAWQADRSCLPASEIGGTHGHS